MKVPLTPDATAALSFQRYEAGPSIDGVYRQTLRAHRGLEGWFMEHLRLTDGRAPQLIPQGVWATGPPGCPGRPGERAGRGRPGKRSRRGRRGYLRREGRLGAAIQFDERGLQVAVFHGGVDLLGFRDRGGGHGCGGRSALPPS